MTTFRVGDIVSVEYPFSDLQTHKHRPGLVEVGLPRASTVRLTKLATIDHRLIHHIIGRLHSEDSRAVVQAWQQLAATVVTLLSE